MIMIQRLTGYGKDSALILSVSTYETVMGGEGGINFYDGNEEDVPEVVDISLEGDVTRIYTSGHNQGDFIQKYSAREQEMRDEVNLHLALPENGERRIFTINLRTMRVLTRADFGGYYPKLKGHNLFIFRTSEESGGFPYIYCVSPYTISGPNSLLFRTQVMASRYCLRPSGPTTAVGRELVFRLFASYYNKQWQEELPSGIRTVSFPNSLQEEIPSYYNTEAMVRHAETLGADLIMQSSGEVVQANSDDVFGKENLDTIKAKIHRDMMDKGTIQLSDLMAVGVEDFLKEVPDKSPILGINQDIHGGFLKGCAYEGRIHILVRENDSDFDFGSVLGADDEFFVVHTKEENFPKRESNTAIVKTAVQQILANNRKDLLQ